MTKAERSDRIMTRLALQGRAEVSELAVELGVSEMTVRRDLEELERAGVLRRVHGGAVPSSLRSYEPPLELRRGRAATAKRAIGAAVADLLRPGETVLLDTGSTTSAVADALVGRDDLTVLTTSLPIAARLVDEPGLRVIALGGQLRRGEHSMIGPLALAAIERFHLDTCVLGAGGIDADAGVTEYDLDDAAIKRAVVLRSRRVVVAADASKVGTVAFATVAPTTSVSALVTDAPPDAPEVGRLAEAGVDVRSV